MEKCQQQKILLLNAILLSTKLFTKRSSSSPFYSLRPCSLNAHSIYQKEHLRKFTLREEENIIYQLMNTYATFYTWTRVYTNILVIMNAGKFIYYYICISNISLFFLNIQMTVVFELLHVFHKKNKKLYQVKFQRRFLLPNFFKERKFHHDMFQYHKKKLIVHSNRILQTMFCFPHGMFFLLIFATFGCELDVLLDLFHVFSSSYTHSIREFRL